MSVAGTAVVVVDVDQMFPPVDEVVDVVPESTKSIGQCKWFNAALGYGFLTICNGSDAGKDIFVHHSGVRPSNSHYRTLWKGEYVSFSTVTGPNGPQATDVTGVCNGSLMCDIMPVRAVSRNSTTPPPPPPPPPAAVRIDGASAPGVQHRASGRSRRAAGGARAGVQSLQSLQSL